MRFSLRSFLMVLFVLSLTISHLYTSWQLRDARREIVALRNELGFLTIVDRDRLNLIYLGGYSWRVYVPPGAHYVLRGTAAHIPAKGHPHLDQAELLDVNLPEGEFTLTANVQFLEDEWKLRVKAGRLAGMMIGVRDEELHNWAEATQGVQEWTTRRGEKEVETFDRDESFDLIREHRWKAKGNVPIRTPGPMPSYGMLLWVEAH